MTEKRMLVAETRRETGTGWPPPPGGRRRITGRIRALVVRPERALTRSGEPVKRKMTVVPEPKDKLDATTNVVVNGPEDAPFDWRQVDWRRVESEVRRLRQRIFTASKAGDLARVRQLQKLMLRSRFNTLVSVRRVTERNAGRLTAGVDGEVVLTPEAKAEIGRPDSAPGRAVQGPASQAGVYPEEGQQHQAPSIRDSRDSRPLPPGTGRQRVGTRMGGQVRAEVLRV